MCLLLAACSVPPRTYKIALVAPFEGRQRQVGYDAFPALRMAVRDAIAAQPNATQQITFIAYNDNADPEFAKQVAANVIVDPDVLLVIGHLITPTTQAALPLYAQAGLPMILLDGSATNCAQHAFHLTIGNEQLAQAQTQIDTQFTAVSGGPPPGANSALAYATAQLALQTIRADIAQHGRPTRAGAAALLAQQAGCA